MSNDLTHPPQTMSIDAVDGRGTTAATNKLVYEHIYYPNE